MAYLSLELVLDRFDGVECNIYDESQPVKVYVCYI